MLLLNLKHSINSLKRNRIFSILNLAGLSIGLTVVTLIALFLMSEYSKDGNIPDHENIYRLYDAAQKNCALDYNLNRELSEHYPEIKKACAVRTFFGFDVPLTSEKNIVVEKKAFLTTNAFFDMFDIDILESISSEPLTEHKLSASPLLSKTFLFPAFLLLLLFILINSIASIYIFSKFDIRTFLAGGKSKSNSHTGRNILTVFQLTISAALLISIIVIKKQISFVKHSDIGFDRENLIRVNFPIGISEANAVTFKNKVSQLSFILSASLSNGVPGMINHTSTSNVEDNEFEFVDLLVDNDFVRTMGISLKAGRDFRNGERNDICIINETAFKKYGWDDFEGKHYEGWGKLDVVGIVSDFNISSLHSLPAPVCLIFGDKRDDYAQLSLRMRKGDTGQMLKGIENEWHSMFPALPFYYTFYDQFFDSMYKKEEKVSSILTYLTFLAFLITCSGIFGVSFQNSIIRTKEIGIRKVNGAKIREVLVILNKDFVRQTIFALIIAIPLSYFAMNKWLQGFAYKTSQNIWIFLLAVMVTLSLVIVTVSLQAWRIARLNPVDALRYE